MTVDRLRWWHIEAAVAIEAELFGIEQWTPAMFWNELANGHTYLGAFVGEELVGYGGLAINPPGEAWINNIAVRRDQQRHGLGRRLLVELLAVARQAGADQVLLEVAADNEPAQRLYAGHGFEVIGVRRGYYQASNTDALVMRKDEV
ncbi:MAG TPA: ribosomal protein S18-alanine N-acetyltransferase [Micromonosporaceae bacterium]